MSTIDLSAYEGKAKIPIRSDQLLLMLPDRRNGLNAFNDLFTKGYDLQVDNRSYQGNMLVIVSAKQRRPITTDDVAEIETLTKTVGGKVSKTGEVPWKFGPDGKTLIVEPRVVTVTPKPDMTPRKIVNVMSFPSRAKAEEFGRYVSGWKLIHSTKGKRAEVKASRRAPEHYATQDSIELAPLAEKFGGKFEYAEAQPWQEKP